MMDSDRRARLPGWHEKRFSPYPTKVEVACLECGRAMWLPACKVGAYLRCGPECNAAWRARERAALERPCQACGKVFRPRPAQVAAGVGRFCSHKCHAAGTGHISSPENLARAQDGKRRAIAEGRVVFPSGEANWKWKGGPAATRKRRTESGKSAQEVREYRRKNPDKVREFTQRRSARKTGALPRGTIKRIGGAQGWKCAICRRGIKRAYHADHIMPLARGGEHAPANLQLLCGPCNLAKSAKDPLDHMRALGWLL